MFLNSNLATTQYTITFDYDVLNTNSWLRIRKINGILYAKGAFYFNDTVTSISAWQDIVVGQVTDWDNSSVTNLLLLTTIGYDMPTLGINILDSGEIVITSHRDVSDINTMWFYGNGISML